MYFWEKRPSEDEQTPHLHPELIQRAKQDDPHHMERRIRGARRYGFHKPPPPPKIPGHADRGEVRGAPAGEGLREQAQGGVGDASRLDCRCPQSPGHCPCYAREGVRSAVVALEEK